MKKIEHHLPGVEYWGKRGDVDLRVNVCQFNAGDIFPDDPLHYHKTRTTYFCVLIGILVVEVDDKEVTLNGDSMLEVRSSEVYRTVKIGEAGCTFIVIGSHNEPDRIVVKK